jgi:hypothetical protein
LLRLSSGGEHLESLSLPQTSEDGRHGASAYCGLRSGFFSFRPTFSATSGILEKSAGGLCVRGANRQPARKDF